MKLSTAVQSFLTAALFCTILIGCKSDGPLSVQNSPVVAQEPNFLKLPANMSLQKIVADSGLITPEHGGKVGMHFKYDYISAKGKLTKLEVDLDLTFPKGAVTDSMVVAMSIDDEVLMSSIDITFNPHGSIFLKPALLDVHVSGMDLDAFDPKDKVFLYYDENGTWVKMVAKKITVNIDKGAITCDNGELPHFSRYAFGT